MSINTHVSIRYVAITSGIGVAQTARIMHYDGKLKLAVVDCIEHGCVGRVLGDGPPFTITEVHACTWVLMFIYSYPCFPFCLHVCMFTLCVRARACNCTYFTDITFLMLACTLTQAILDWLCTGRIL